jgi:hypothetical protein
VALFFSWLQSYHAQRIPVFKKSFARSAILLKAIPAFPSKNSRRKARRPPGRQHPTRVERHANQPKVVLRVNFMIWIFDEPSSHDAAALPPAGDSCNRRKPAFKKALKKTYEYGQFCSFHAVICLVYLYNFSVLG